MFEWLKRKKPEPVVEEPAGLFSTDFSDIVGRPPSLSEMLGKSIRKSPRRIDDNGGVFAQDDADLVKPYEDEGNFIPANQINWYSSQGFIGYQLCAVIAQNWLVNKACSLPGRDALRHGYDITINDGSEASPELVDRIKRADKRHKIKREAEEFIRMGRIFGIRHALPLVDYGSPDATYAAWERPFNIDGVRPDSYRGIVQIDPYWITPELDGVAASDPASRHFYEPTWWRVSGHRIHRSHLIIFRNGEVPDVLKPTYFYGGIPLPQLISERVYAAERTANEAPALALSKRTTLLHADLKSMASRQADAESVLSAFARYRDNFGVKIVGLNETAEQFDTSLADFDATIMSQYQLVAAIAGVPATKLMGTSPKGFGATGEYDMRSYHEELESIQENDITPLIERHHEIVLRSLGIKDLSGVTISWNAVAPLTEKEKAEVNEIKSRAGNNLVTSGAIDGQDERNRIIADKDSEYTGLETIAPEKSDEDALY